MTSIKISNWLRPVDKYPILKLHKSLSLGNFEVPHNSLLFLYLTFQTERQRELYQQQQKERKEKKRKKQNLEIVMDRQKSMEKGLLRKSLSIRERKFPNEDAFLESGLPRKSPREIKKPQNDELECRVTASVFLSTFVAVAGSFCTGCGVSSFFRFDFGSYRFSLIFALNLRFWCWINWTGLIDLDVSVL